MTVTWPMVSGACLTLALLNLRIALGDSRRAPHFFFFMCALAVAAVSWLELALMRSDTVAECQAVLRWASVPLTVMVAAVTGFVWSFFGTGRAWLAVVGVGLHGLSQLVNLVTKVPAVREVTAMRKVETWGGAIFTVPTIRNGPWAIAEVAGMVLAALFVLDASVALAKRGQRRRAWIVGGSAIFFLSVSRGHALLVENGHLQTPYLVSFAFLGLLLAMGHELSGEVFRSAKLSRDLVESERRIDLAARAAKLGFWTWDVVRDEIWASDTARALFEIDAAERVRIGHFLGALHAEDRDGVKQALEAALAGGMEYEKEYRVVLRGGGHRWIAARGRVELNERGKAVLMRGVLLDITASRLSEHELEQVRGQLAHAGRVSMMGQLASALAHELNQPLGAILRNAEAAELFLRGDTPNLEEVRAIVGDIRRDDQRAGEVIDRLRALLKRRTIEPQTLRIDEILGEVLSLARADASARNVRLEVVTEPMLPLVLGDRVHLQQVLLNLIINAMDALREAPGAERRVTVSAQQQDGEFIEVSVADTGHGIPAGGLEHVFEAFYTTKPNGMGMGLPISKTIVEAHGGRLVAQHREGGGTVFRFTLPAATV